MTEFFSRPSNQRTGAAAAPIFAVAAVAGLSVSIFQLKVEIFLVFLAILALALWRRPGAFELVWLPHGHHQPAEANAPHSGGQSELSVEDAARIPQLLEDAIPELRGHVNTILGFAELIGGAARRDSTEADRQLHVRTLLDSSRKLSASLADFGDLARLERGALKLVDGDVDAAELAETAIRHCRDAAEHANVDVLACLQDGIELRCDAARVGRALLTLGLRVIGGLPEGAAVRLAFERTADDGLAIVMRGHGAARREVESREPADSVSIDLALSAVAFSIAKRIAMLHGGKITVESLQGAGTEARFIFPSSRVLWMTGITSRAVQAA
jgi:signal transduction histidine kinase